jgi:putative proteasome-type protease
MTFCLGIAVDDGLVGLADTRLMAGNECLTGRKAESYSGPGFCFFIMTSGLRSVRDKVLLHFDEAFARASQHRDRLYKVVELFTEQVRRASREDRHELQQSELKFDFHALIGGQMAGDSSHRLFLIYPEGNWVQVGSDTPYQIIGASGFGKPILERSVTSADSILFAFKVGILAFDATRLCAGDVDFPLDVLLYKKNSFEMVEHRFQRDDLREISEWWQERIRASVHELPSQWIDRAFSRLTEDVEA